MTTALVPRKTQVPGYFNYTHYSHVIKKSYPLVKASSKGLTEVEDVVFAELINETLVNKKEKSAVKGDLPLSSEFGDINPLWLLFTRNSLKKLQYR